MAKEIFLKEEMEIFFKKTIKNDMYHKGSKWRFFLKEKKEFFFTLKSFPLDFKYETIDWEETIMIPKLKERNF